MEVATKLVEKESGKTFVEQNYIMPETEIEEPLNEPVNEVAKDLSEITGETIEVKATRGRKPKVK